MNIINSSLYNIISIILGLLAIVFAVYNIITVSKKSRLHNSFLATLSTVACVLSLYFQILWIGHLATTNNLTTILDTYSMTQFGSTLLVIITFTLNIVGFILAKSNKSGMDSTPTTNHAPVSNPSTLPVNQEVEENTLEDKMEI